MPSGFSVQMGGQTAQQREAFASLAFMSILALMLVYMVMASQFRSLKDPFIIMFSVPMGLIGVILALFLTRTTLSTTSFMGIIMMVGIVVSNGVLLVEYTNELRRRGLAARRGGRAGRADPAPPDPDDQPGDGVRPHADGARLARRRRGQRAAGAGRHRGPHRLHRAHPDPDSRRSTRSSRSASRGTSRSKRRARPEPPAGSRAPGLPLDKGDSAPMRTRSRRRRAGPRPSRWRSASRHLARVGRRPGRPRPPRPRLPPPRPRRPRRRPCRARDGVRRGTPLQLNLAEATALALRQQPTIRSAQGSLTAAQARVPQARSAYFPRIDLQAGVQTSEFKSTTTNNRQRSESTFATLLGRPAHLRLREDRGARERGAGREPRRVRGARAGARPRRPERPAVVLQPPPGAAARRSRRRRALALRAEPPERPGLLRRRHEAEVGRDAGGGRGRERARRRDPGSEPRPALGDEPGQRPRPRGDGADRDRGHPHLRARDPGFERSSSRRRSGTGPSSASARPGWTRPAPSCRARGRGTSPTSRSTAARACRATTPWSPPTASARLSFADTWSITGQLTWNLFEGFFTQAKVKETQALVETARANYDDPRAPGPARGGAGVHHRDRGRRAVRRHGEGGRVRAGEPPAGPGTLRRRGRDHPRPDRGPALPDERRGGQRPAR